MAAILTEEVPYALHGHDSSVGKAFIYFLFDKNETNNGTSHDRVWILGASYNSTSKFDSEEKSRCGRDSCYQKSLNKKQICKPGKLFFQMQN